MAKQRRCTGTMRTGKLKQLLSSARWLGRQPRRVRENIFKLFLHHVAISFTTNKKILIEDVLLKSRLFFFIRSCSGSVGLRAKYYLIENIPISFTKRRILLFMKLLKSSKIIGVYLRF